MRRCSMFGLSVLIALLMLNGVPMQGVAQPFTYQGYLRSSGAPANGAFDFEFRLFTAATGGSQVGSTVSFNDLNVQNGLFTTELNFGALNALWNGADRFLEIRVRPGISTGAYTTLNPRIKLNPTPYSFYAAQAPWSGLIGIPAGFADGIDNDTTYTAGAGLQLSGTTFSIATGGVATSMLADLSVTTVKIANDAVNSNKLANDAASLSKVSGNVMHSASSRIGIGTTNPQATLHVFRGTSGAAPNSNAVIALENSSHTYINLLAPAIRETGVLFGNPSENATGGIIYNHFATPNGMQFRTNGNVTRAVISDIGNVGIGTVAPAYLLEVSANQNSRLVNIVNANFGDSADGLHVRVTGSTAIGVAVLTQGAESVAVSAGASGTQGVAVRGTASGSSGIGVLGSATGTNGWAGYFVGRSHFSGRVGINTLNPQSPLHTLSSEGVPLTVQGDNAAAYINVLTPGNRESGVLFSNPDFAAGGIVYNNPGNPNGLQFRTNGNTTRAVITNIGRMGIGTGVPAARLHVEGDGVNRSTAIVSGAFGEYPTDWPSEWGGGLSTADILCRSVRASNYTTRSDERLKRDLQPLDSFHEYERLLSLRPLTYYWRDERLNEAMQGKPQFGFSAQELSKVFPELVLEGSDPDKTLSVDYQALIPLLVNALQVQHEEIRQLREELQQLRTQMNRTR